jgi:hypothetical protein
MKEKARRLQKCDYQNTSNKKGIPYSANISEAITVGRTSQIRCDSAVTLHRTCVQSTDYQEPE